MSESQEYNFEFVGGKEGIVYGTSLEDVKDKVRKKYNKNLVDWDSFVGPVYRLKSLGRLSSW
jgi:hypothetical protein